MIAERGILWFHLTFMACRYLYKMAMTSPNTLLNLEIWHKILPTSEVPSFRYAGRGFEFRVYSDNGFSTSKWRKYQMGALLEIFSFAFIELENCLFSQILFPSQPILDNDQKPLID